jgi:integrase
MSVFRRKRSSYFQYDFEYRGQRYRGSCETADKRLAEAYVRRLRSRIEQETLSGKRPEMTLDAALARYMQEVAQFQSSLYDVHRMNLRLAPALGKTRGLTEIDDDLLGRYIVKRRGEKARRKDTTVSNATVNREIEYLRRVFKRAETIWKVQVTQPNWKVHKLHEASEREVSLPPDAFQRLLDHLREDYHPLFKAARASGIRLNNLIGLRWSQVEEKAVRLRVKSKEKDGREVLFPLVGEFADIIAAERKRNDRHAEFVFTYDGCHYRDNEVGRLPFSQNGWRKFFIKAREAAGLPSLRFHDLRHAFGNALYAATGNLKVVQRAMGHADISSTMRYLHADMGDVIAGLSAMAPVASGPTGENVINLSPLRKQSQG